MQLFPSIPTTTRVLFSELSLQEARRVNGQEDQACKATPKSLQATSWTDISYKKNESPKGTHYPRLILFIHQQSKYFFFFLTLFYLSDVH